VDQNIIAGLPIDPHLEFAEILPFVRTRPSPRTAVDAEAS